MFKSPIRQSVFLSMMVVLAVFSDPAPKAVAQVTVAPAANPLPRLEVAPNAVSEWSRKLRRFDRDIRDAVRAPNGGELLYTIADTRFRPVNDFVRMSLLNEAACALGYTPACFMSSAMFSLDLTGVPKDIVKSTTAAARACSGNHFRGCNRLAEMIWEKPGRTPADEAAAFGFWDKACSGTLPAGCQQVAVGTLWGRPENFNTVSMRAVLTASCRTGEQKSCQHIALLDALPDTLQQISQMSSEARQALNSTNRPKSISDLARAAILARQFPMALQLFQAACNLADGPSCSDTTAMYNGAHGSPVNATLLARFAVQGCNLDNANSCVNQAAIFKPATANQADREASLRFFKKACTLNSAIGCRSVAVMHNNGWGTPQNAALGRQAHEKACTLGDQPSCGLMAERQAEERATADALANLRFTRPTNSDSNVLVQCAERRAVFYNLVDQFNDRSRNRISLQSSQPHYDPNHYVNRHTRDSESTCGELLFIARRVDEMACSGKTYSDMMLQIPLFEAVSYTTGTCYHESLKMGANWNIRR